MLEDIVKLDRSIIKAQALEMAEVQFSSHLRTFFLLKNPLLHSLAP